MKLSRCLCPTLLLLALFAECAHLPTEACAPPEIQTSPVADTVTAPATASFTVVVSGTGPFTYLWQRTNPGSSAFADVSTGAGGNAASYTTAPTSVSSDSGAMYQCVVTGQCGHQATTAPVMLVVGACVPPGISAQSVADTVTAPVTALFTVAVSGTGPFTYQWQRANPGSSTYVDLAADTGGTVASYATAATSVSSDSGATYRCVVSGQCGSTASTTPITLVVNTGCVAPGIATQPKADTIAARATATFTVVASGTGLFTYQWQRADPGSSTFTNVTAGAGGNAASYTTVPTTVSFDSGAMYRCVVSGHCGPPAITAPAMLTVEHFAMTDIDGNVYHAVTIGTQVWMVENLRTTHYNDGSPIPLDTGIVVPAQRTSPRYCWYVNDSAANMATYGALYNWYAVSTGRLAPTGWHVPTDSEWSVLVAYIGGDSVAGGALKEADTTHWSFPNTGATNAYSFAALPGGYYYADGGSFDNIGHGGFWWSATAYNATDSWYRYLGYNNAMVYRTNGSRSFGLSVRCIRDP